MCCTVLIFSAKVKWPIPTLGSTLTLSNTKREIISISVQLFFQLLRNIFFTSP